jgi:hypothetical protein
VVYSQIGIAKVLVFLYLWVMMRKTKYYDLVVAPSILTNKDKQFISDIIADYKRTGKVLSKKRLHKSKQRPAVV